jgi:hypothetical protein
MMASLDKLDFVARPAAARRREGISGWGGKIHRHMRLATTQAESGSRGHRGTELDPHGIYTPALRGWR